MGSIISLCSLTFGVSLGRSGQGEDLLKKDCRVYGFEWTCDDSDCWGKCKKTDKTLNWDDQCQGSVSTTRQKDG